MEIISNRSLSKSLCVFCASSCPRGKVEGEKQKWESVGSIETSSDTSNDRVPASQSDTTGEKCLSNNANDSRVSYTEIIGDDMKSAFILKKLLDYPTGKYAKYLIHNEGKLSPSSWLPVCSTCDDCVKRCFQLHIEILKLCQRLEKIKTGLKDDIYKSESCLQTLEETEGNLWLEVRKFVCSDLRKNRSRETSKNDDPFEFSKIFLNPKDRSSTSDSSKHEACKTDEESQSGRESCDNLCSIDKKNKVDKNSEIESVLHTNTKTLLSPTRKRSFHTQISSKRSVLLKQQAFLTRSTKRVRKNPQNSGESDATNPNTPLAPLHRHSYKCDQCVGFFYVRIKMERHSNLHKSGDGVPCKICGWLLNSGYVQRHMDHFHSNKPDNLSNSTKEPVKQLKLVKCKECGARLKSRSLLLTHLELHKKHIQGQGNAVYCPDCGILVENLTLLSEHTKECQVQIHKKKIEKARTKKKVDKLPHEIAYYCDYCPLVYTQKRILTQHFNAMHAGRDLVQCAVCSDAFISKQLLDIHCAQEHGESSVGVEKTEESAKMEVAEGEQTCPHCSEKFSSKSKLDYHIVKNHREEMWSCKLCSYKTNRSSFWRSHMQTHTGDRPYICHLCDKTYRSNASLKSHLRQVHYQELGLEPLKCPHCETILYDNAALRVHVASVHEGIRSHCCDICGKSFGLKDNLKKHMNVWHADPEKEKELMYPTSSHFFVTSDGYHCGFCKKVVQQHKSIAAHIRKVHPDRTDFRCAGCDKQYCTPMGLRNHQAGCEAYQSSLPQRKTFKCKFCSDEFNNNNRLVDHRKRAHADKFLTHVCDICGHRLHTLNALTKHKAKKLCKGKRLQIKYEIDTSQEGEKSITAEINCPPTLIEYIVN